MKGSPYPRSYYKCSHQGCQVKKIVERSPRTGHISCMHSKVRLWQLSQDTSGCSEQPCKELHAPAQGTHTHAKPAAGKASGMGAMRLQGRDGRFAGRVRGVCLGST